MARRKSQYNRLTESQRFAIANYLKGRAIDVGAMSSHEVEAAVKKDLGLSVAWPNLRRLIIAHKLTWKKHARNPSRKPKRLKGRKAPFLARVAALEDEVRAIREKVDSLAGDKPAKKKTKRRRGN